MGDFGVPIAIVLMVVVAWAAGDTYTEKLDVPTGITVGGENTNLFSINRFLVTHSPMVGD